MVIKVFPEGGKWIVTDDSGLRTECDNQEQAVVYARGLQDGYNAAGRKIGRCFGWKHG